MEQHALKNVNRLLLWVQNNPTNICIFPTNIHIFHFIVLHWQLLRMSNTDAAKC